MNKITLSGITINSGQKGPKAIAENTIIPYIATLLG